MHRNKFETISEAVSVPLYPYNYGIPVGFRY